MARAHAGGVRIVRSRDAEAYATNLKHLFEECYGLANTQERKNKDIPEGGSKGVILLDVKSQKQEHAENAFKKYVDSLLDILLSDQGEPSPLACTILLFAVALMTDFLPLCYITQRARWSSQSLTITAFPRSSSLGL